MTIFHGIDSHDVGNDPAETIHQLRRDAGHLLLRRALDRNDWISEALYEIAAGDQVKWTPKQWNTLLADLRRTPGTVDDYLDLNT